MHFIGSGVVADVVVVVVVTVVPERGAPGILGYNYTHRHSCLGGRGPQPPLAGNNCNSTSGRTSGRFKMFRTSG